VFSTIKDNDMASCKTLLSAKGSGSTFTYLEEWEVLLCRDCGFCIFPGRSSQARHLRNPPHQLRGAELTTLLDLFTSYKLRVPLTTAEREGVLLREGLGSLAPSKAVEGLRSRPGFACLLCLTFLSCDLKNVSRHVSKQHSQRPAEQVEGTAYTQCTLQTFFAEKKYIKYFRVDNSGDLSSPISCSIAPAEEEFLRATLKAQEESRAKNKAVANLVAPLDTHKSEVIPWLRATGIAEHLQGLQKDEIATAIALPLAVDRETDFVLPRLLDILELVLREAHSWCFPGPDQKLTWPRQLALSRFQKNTPLATASVSRRIKGFDPYKEASTLVRYFRSWKQLLCYHYRVVYKGGHFTQRVGGAKEQPTPDKTIQVTSTQQETWDYVVKILEADNPNLDLHSLKSGVQRLCLAMIRVEYSTKRYTSSLVSFCAMLSVEPLSLAWKEAGNYNSFLSGLIWTTQLLIFRYCVTKVEDRLGLKLIQQVCERFLTQEGETPMGEVLRWRLLLFRVSKETVGQRQATWDKAEEVLTYNGTELRLDEVPKLILSEFQEAERYLYDELMLGFATSLPRIHSWALKDNHDVKNVGWFFGLYRPNTELLQPLQEALLHRLFRSPTLRATFLKQQSATGRGQGSSSSADSNAVEWQTKALIHYEAIAGKFLKRLLVLTHITAGQPLREPELLSLTWRNTQKRRGITIKHDLVMLHTTYHKGQQQTGTFKDNIRLLPTAVGDLLLEYLVYIVPLREVFLRHLTPTLETSDAISAFL
jgi:hypothetical protein